MFLSSAACVCNYWTAFPDIIKAAYTLGGISALLGRQTIVIGLVPRLGIPSWKRGLGPCRIALSRRFGQTECVNVVCVVLIVVGRLGIRRDCGCVSPRLASRDCVLYPRDACFLCVCNTFVLTPGALSANAPRFHSCLLAFQSPRLPERSCCHNPPSVWYHPSLSHCHRRRHCGCRHVCGTKLRGGCVIMRVCDIPSGAASGLNQMAKGCGER